MDPSRRPGRRAATAATAVVAAALVGAACVPPRPPVPQPQRATAPKTATAPDDHTVVLGADVLVRQYGLTRSDALQRMRNQPAAIAAALDLQSRLGLPTGSVWIDHSGGGRVVARASSAEAPGVAAAVGEQHGVLAVTVPSERTPAEIEAAAAGLAVALQEDGVDGFAVRYDPVTDAFAVDVPPADAADDEPPVDTAEDAATDAGLEADDVTVDEVPGIQTAACTADGRHCDAPLRGATTIRAQTATSLLYCSGGFVGRTSAAGAPVVLTAGHCAAGAGASGVWSAYTPAAAAWQALGTASGTAFGASGDSAAVAVRDAAAWTPAAAVVAGPSSVQPAGTLSESYRIDAVQRPVVGAVLCLSGSSTGTSCGEVTQAGVTVSYATGGGAVLVNGLAGLDLRGRGQMCTGDSGGPVYANGLGFGLVSGGSLSGGTRTIDNGVYRVTVSCGSRVVYLEDLARAASRLGVVVGARDWTARGW